MLELVILHLECKVIWLSFSIIEKSRLRKFGELPRKCETRDREEDWVSW